MELDLNEIYVDGLEELTLKVKQLDMKENHADKIEDFDGKAIDMEEIKERNLKVIDVDEIKGRNPTVIEVSGIREFDLNEDLHEDGIEDRMKHLVDVIFRARQHESRQKQGQVINNFEGEPLLNPNNVHDLGGAGVKERKIELEKIGIKFFYSYLVAKALQKECGEKTTHCKICFKFARESVLTYCNHLFCRTCFYQVPNTLYGKKCPVCLRRVVEEDLLHMYYGLYDPFN